VHADGGLRAVYVW